MNCPRRKCNGKMKPGKALKNTVRQHGEVVLARGVRKHDHSRPVVVMQAFQGAVVLQAEHQHREEWLDDRPTRPQQGLLVADLDVSPSQEEKQFAILPQLSPVNTSPFACGTDRGHSRGPGPNGRTDVTTERKC